MHDIYLCTPTYLPHAVAPKIIEPCEDVRLKLMRLVRAMADAMDSGVAAYAGELTELIKVCAHDPYHECLIVVCGLCDLLTATLGRRLMQGNLAKHLVAAIAPLTAHRRAPVRAAAATSLGPLITHGAHEMILEICAFIDPNYVPVKAFYEGEVKANYLGKMATDSSVTVRLAFLRHCLDPWMTEMTERKDHEPRLVAYVLGFLHDEDETVCK